MQVHRHVDGGLEAEQDRKAGGAEARERILVAHGVTQAAQHNEGEHRGEHQAQHDAEFFGCDSEHEIGVTLGQDALDRAFARAAPEPAAALEGFDRLVDVEGVAGGGIAERSRQRILSVSCPCRLFETRTLGRHLSGPAR